MHISDIKINNRGIMPKSSKVSSTFVEEPPSDTNSSSHIDPFFNSFLHADQSLQIISSNSCGGSSSCSTKQLLS